MVPKVTPSCHFVALSAQTPRLAWLGYQVNYLYQGKIFGVFQATQYRDYSCCFEM